MPFAALLIPLWSIAHNLHITNTYLALILPPLANPLGVFLMRQFILGLPKDLENAARLEESASSASTGGSSCRW